MRGLHLVVDDIAGTRADLPARGIQIGKIYDLGGGVNFAEVADPDGNTLTLQEMAWRTGNAFRPDHPLGHRPAHTGRGWKN